MAFNTGIVRTWSRHGRWYGFVEPRPGPAVCEITVVGPSFVYALRQCCTLRRLKGNLSKANYIQVLISENLDCTASQGVVERRSCASVGGEL